MPALEITTKIGCKNLCDYCPQDKIVKAYSGKRLMSFEDFVAIMKNVPKNVRIDFSGFSEAFLNSESSRMMRHAIEEGYRVNLYTTFVGFNENDIKALNGLKFSEVVSHKFDSKNFNQEEFDKQTKLFEDNIQKVDRTAIVDGDGVNTMKVSRGGSVFFVHRKIGAFHCYLCGKEFHNNVVLPNGDAYICCMDYGLEHKIGNLFETNFNELNRQSLVDLSNQENSDIVCRKCEWFVND